MATGETSVRRLMILHGTSGNGFAPPGTRTIRSSGLRDLLREFGPIRAFGSHEEVTVLTHRLEFLPAPFLAKAVAWFLGRRASVRDEQGAAEDISFARVADAMARLVRDALRRPLRMKEVLRDIAALERSVGPDAGARPRSGGRPVYLRTDLHLGIRSGGSVGHVAGVLNNLGSLWAEPVFLTTDQVPTVKKGMRTHEVPPDPFFWDFREVPSIFFNRTFYEKTLSATQDLPVAFVYQRYSRNNYAGLRFAKHRGVPFVLEYNGSEVWIARNWGRPLKYEALTERIELLNLKGADVVVVVSRPMRDELAARGIDPEKILVNPNGVDPDRYSPDVDAAPVRRRHGLGEATVVGFIGTFGRWHGAEVLADAFGRLLERWPEYRKSVRLMMIGDGLTMGEVRESLARWNTTAESVLTGLVPQEDGPAHLAACDVLVAPHVPNPDGSPFFGSPTKLFEYMAMGRGIVASDLDQIGEVLDHDRTAWLVAPGDVDALVEGLRVLLEDRERRNRLGREAREEAVARHTWKEHTRRILDKLGERCGGR
jgi:glycosyltransferase involved in cell wall biosynthesis